LPFFPKWSRSFLTENALKFYAAVIFDEKIGNHCMIGQKWKSGLFLQDFIWEKGILDKNKCPFSKTQPLSLF
jgi:hypothetical protein